MWYTGHQMTSLGRIEARSIRDQVYAKLEQAVVDGTFRPNSVLSDRHLSETLGVSRTPIRDALHMLESSGLVQRRGRIGWIVTGISLRDVEELFELRCLLEPAGVAKIVHWSDEALHKLAATFDEFTPDLNSSQIPHYLVRDDAFHKALCTASENGRLVHFYGVMARQIHRIRESVSYRYQGRVNQSLIEHRAICAALLKRDEQAATQALVAHLGTAKDKFIELYAQLLEEHPDAAA
ncbi:MAG: GntR family transcriptional regulator [Truepera sp.]|nr:GntR family transcriptional regulator [Truepera sp.]